jgi:hypothetical protein
MTASITLSDVSLAAILLAAAITIVEFFILLRALPRDPSSPENEEQNVKTSFHRAAITAYQNQLLLSA